MAHVRGPLGVGGVFYRRGEVLVDLVPIRGNLDPPRRVGELAGIVWPAGFLTPHVALRKGVLVPTLTPAGHRAVKAAAPDNTDLRDKDRADLAALATLPA